MTIFQIYRGLKNTMDQINRKIYFSIFQVQGTLYLGIGNLYPMMRNLQIFKTASK